MKLRIYADMPWSVRLRTGLAPFRGQSPKAIIEPRVGDDDALSYTQLYRQLLDLVRAESIACLEQVTTIWSLPSYTPPTQLQVATHIVENNLASMQPVAPPP